MNIEMITKSVKHPNLVARALNRLYYSRFRGNHYNSRGTDVLDKDWDNLLILDACRYDIFERRNDIPGELSHVESRGSNTVEFLKGNFADRELLDTVYITANPQYHRHADQLDTTFHAVHDVWLEDGWDKQHGTVHPELLTERAKYYAEEYPNKRLIVHYVQPHYPFIGESGENVFDDTQAFLKPDEHGSWEQIVRGKLNVSKEAIWDAYLSNLDLVLPYVKELSAELKGQTVITSDHGNMVGERSSPIPNTEWGHISGLYTEQLVKVPWLECPIVEERKEITEGEPQEYHIDTDAETVGDRLESLGYMQ